MFRDLKIPNYNSEAYELFSSFALDILIEIVEPMEEERFWANIDEIGWPANSSQITQLSSGIARRLSLEDIVGLCVTALDKTGELEEVIYDIGLAIPSEDAEQDFMYHQIGLGKNAFSIAKNKPVFCGSEVVESFKYVLHGSACFVKIDNYINVFKKHCIFARSHTRPTLNTMRKFSETEPGIVVRIDDSSYEVVTPFDCHVVNFF